MRTAGSNLTRLAWLLPLLAAGAMGQTPQEMRATGGPYTFAPVIVAQTTTVPVSVVVRDRSGHVIRGLQEIRFRIWDNGIPQAITSFGVETGPKAAPAAARGAQAGGSATATAPPATAAAARPRFVALLFDDVNSDEADLMEARNAAVRFMHEELGPGDRMALFTTSSTQSLGFTRDRAELAKTIAEIAPHPRAAVQDLSGCPRISQYDAYLIAVMQDPQALQAKTAEEMACSGIEPTAKNGLPQLAGCGIKCQWSTPSAMTASPPEMKAEAIWEMTRDVAQNTLAAVRDVVDYTGKQPGQRVVVLASSGFLSETLGNQKEQIIRDALRAGVTIDALDAKGLYTQAPGPPLRDMGDEPLLPTSALIFEETSKFPAEEAENDAMASFAAATGGLFFQNNNDLTLGFERLGLAPRLSYALSFTPHPLVRDGKLHRLRIRLDPPIPGATIEARRGYFAPAPGLSRQGVERAVYLAMASTATAEAVPATLAVSAGSGDAQVLVHLSVTRPDETVVLVAGLFRANGSFVVGERGEVELALKKATFQKLSKTGLAPKFDLKAAAGDYRLRVVVLDEGSGALSEFNRTVRVQ